MAFDQSKAENEANEPLIQFENFRNYLIIILKLFNFYFLFKKLDINKNDKLNINDLVNGIVLLRRWGGAVQDTKQVKQLF